MDELKLSDLFVVCDKCGGTGQHSWQVESAVRRGVGTHQISQYGPCDKCNGAGGTITPSGEVLAQFVQVLRRHGRL